MGNNFCACTRRKSKPKELNGLSNIQVNIAGKPQLATPYDNEPLKSILTNNSQNFSTSNDTSNNEFLITPEYQNDYQSPNESIYSQINKRPSFDYNSHQKERDSVFSPKLEILTPDSQSNDYDSQVYEFILKDFLNDNFPFNNEIIYEMTRRNLLTENDGASILSVTEENNISELFLSKFTFSEVNVCKLATFLFVLISEKSLIFYNLDLKEIFLNSIVDHIYYVVNFISLLQKFSDQTERIKFLIFNSSLIDFIYGKKKPITQNDKRNNENPISIRIHIDELIFPSLFWSYFSKINEDFQCCEELLLTSCNLHAEDIYNLIQGLRTSSALRSLDVSTNPITDVGLKHIQSLFQVKNQIESINLTCCSLTCEGVEEFLEILSRNTFKSHLKSLSLSHNELDDMSEKSILILTKLSLVILEIQSTNMKCQKALFESLKLNYSLRYLDLSRNKLMNKDLTYLASGLAYNNNLRVVSLAMIGLTKNDIGTMNNTFLMNKSLVSIDLSDNSIGDEGIEILKDILIMKKTLKDIIMKRCNISLNGILLLLRQASDPECRLKLLDLCYNRTPRLSIAIESTELLKKIYDILHQIGLVKKIRILLWGTIDLSVPYYDHIDYSQIKYK